MLKVGTNAIDENGAIEKVKPDTNMGESLAYLVGEL